MRRVEIIIAAITAMILAGHIWILILQTNLTATTTNIAKSAFLADARESLRRTTELYDVESEDWVSGYSNDIDFTTKHWPVNGGLLAEFEFLVVDDSDDLNLEFLLPLIYDQNSSVSAGAVLAVRDILEKVTPEEADYIREEITGYREKVGKLGVKLNLSNAVLRPDDRVSKIDLKMLCGTGLFRGANFRGAVLRSIIFDNCELCGAQFQGATILDTDFVGGDLVRSDWTDATLRGVRFTGKASGGGFNSRCEGYGVSSSELRLTGAIMHGADLARTAFGPAEIWNPNRFERSQLKGASLVGADLSQVEFCETDTSEFDCVGAETSGTKVFSSCDDDSGSVASLVCLGK